MKIEKVADKHLIEFDKPDLRKSKYLQCETINCRIRPEQKHFLDYFCKMIKLKRCKNPKNERITPNTIIRCLIDFLIENHNKMNFSNMFTEEEIYKEINKFDILEEKYGQRL